MCDREYVLLFVLITFVVFSITLWNIPQPVALLMYWFGLACGYAARYYEVQ